MWNMLWPILLVVGANTLYNICTKSTPEGANVFASLLITYLSAAAAALVLYFVTGGGKNLLAEMGKANWTAYALGLSIVALEFGFINVYRAGWKISVASLVCNILLACALLAVGVLVYRESVSPRQLLGAAVCAVGLVLIGL